VIVHEDSMLAARFLILLDQRLRSIYDATRPFGGISVLLVVDFLQLPVTAGTDLYLLMYGALKSEDVMAHGLMESFRVVDMTEQLRAAACADTAAVRLHFGLCRRATLRASAGRLPTRLTGPSRKTCSMGCRPS
jgi:hypothetical protein